MRGWEIEVRFGRDWENRVLAKGAKNAKGRKTEEGGKRTEIKI